MRRVRSEAGFGTLFAVAMTGLLALVTATCVGVVGIVSTHRMAQAAADLAALAGASTAQQGGDACARAAAIARSNQARLTSCQVRGSNVRVKVLARSPKFLGVRHDVPARAHAGPAVSGVPGLAPAPIR